MENSLRADAWALQKLKTYQNGKLLLWSWCSRGYLSIENLANWYHDGDVDAARQSLSSTRGELKKLCELDEIPSVENDQELCELENAESTKLEGETFFTWAIKDLENEAIPPIHLPSWFRAQIDKAITVWQTESRAWEKKREERLLRGKFELPPKAQLAFDEWNSTKTRSIVLDKKRQAQVMNVGNKSISSLKKHCLLVVLHMSHEAEELRIKTGSGKLWRLQLLQCSQKPCEVIPDEVDDFHEGRQ